MNLLKQIRDSLKVDKLMAPVENIARAAKTLESLISLVNDSKLSASAKNMIEGLKLLLQSRPNITSVNHYINHFLLKLDPDNQPIVIKELLEVFQERWKNVDRKTAEIAIQAFDFEQKTLLLHGNDKNVQTLIETLAVKQYKFKIIQTVGRSFDSGKEQASELIRHGYNIRFIDEMAVTDYLDEIDILLLGCEVIMQESFTGEYGGHMLSRLFYHNNKPVFVLADSRRLLNKKYFSKAVTDKIVGTGKKQPDPVWKDAPENIQVIPINELEEIPNQLISKFILENNAYNATELLEQVDKVLVFKFF